MDATVLLDFSDTKLGKRFYAGDVVSISAKDFDRITGQGNYMKKGRHRFGSGVCYPCKRKINKGN